jgi:hypothetical protein
MGGDSQGVINRGGIAVEMTNLQASTDVERMIG